MRHEVSRSYSILFFAALITLFAVQGLYPAQLRAQQDVTLDLILQPNLNKAQVLSISNIGIRQSSSGPPLFNIVIGNDGAESLNNLYLEIQISSNKYGQIASIYQRAGYPFSLSPGERVVANSNQLQDGLPGVEEPVSFDGGLTQEGENFFNTLANSTIIPADIYTLQISIYYGNSSRSGGELIESAEATFGENISVDSVVNLYLLQPGGQVGSGEAINSSLPFFRWDGPTGLSYRLIVVEDNGQSPETLIQSAMGTSPTLDNGSFSGGTLLDYEIIDARTNNVNFTMPPSGVQNLESGQKYYWQVFTNRQGVNTTESIPSEIWEFRLASSETNVTSSLNQEVFNSLRKILTPAQLNQLRQQGYDFISITVDGQTYEGASAVQKLLEMSNKIENDEITIVEE